MKDQFKRDINYMRISVTDRCNLHCRYCMPKNMSYMERQEILSIPEILLVVRAAVSLGIRHFKVTGGEPLVRKDSVRLIREMKQLPGVEEVTLTTNGIFLPQTVAKLQKAGLDRVNVSLDTLNPKRYRELTGRDALRQVLDGISACLEYRLPLRLNTVLQTGGNADEWEALLLLAKHYPLDIRFIETMPIGFGNPKDGISNIRLLQRISERYEIRECPELRGNGPARYYEIPGFLGHIGFISAMHGKFCDSCNRLRMTAGGTLKPCLCFPETLCLREPLRDSSLREEERKMRIREILARAIYEKPKGHDFESGRVTEQRPMSSIGG